MLDYILNHADTSQLIAYLIVLIAIVLPLLALIIKLDIDQVKRLKQCKPIDTGHALKVGFYRLTHLDMMSLFILHTAFYFALDLFMVAHRPVYQLLVVLAVGIGLLVKNRLIDQQYQHRYLLLTLLNHSSGSSEEIIEASNGQLEMETFYKALTPFLKTEMISSYSEGRLIEDRVIYSITPKGKDTYVDYLKFEYQDLRKQKWYLGRKASRGHDVVVDVEYRQVSERLELVERNIALLTPNNNLGIKII